MAYGAALEAAGIVGPSTITNPKDGATREVTLRTEHRALRAEH